jgi:hypothetical protein
MIAFQILAWTSLVYSLLMLIKSASGGQSEKARAWGFCFLWVIIAMTFFYEQFPAPFSK